MTTTTTEKLRITMSERRPLTVDPTVWERIASAERHDGQVECQANRKWAIIVRQHPDGRRLVYGWVRRGYGGMPIGWRGSEGGFLIDAADDGVPNEHETVRAIRRIGGIIGDDQLAAECIAELPAEEI